MPPITSQNLTDAATDATNLGLVVNSASSVATITTRTGTVIPTLAAVLATLAAQQSLVATGAYASGTTYSKNQVAYYSGNSYISLVNSNLNNQPDTHPTQWALFATASVSQTLAQLATIRTALPALPNLFNPSAVTASFYVSGTTGALVASGAYTASGYIVANSGGTMVTSVALNPGTVGYAFYDANLTFISGSTTAVAAGGTISVPSTAVFLRVTLANALVSKAMICNGTSVPSTYVSFVPLQASDLSTSIATSIALTALKLQGGSNLYNSSGVSVGTVRYSDGVVDATQTTFRASNFMLCYGQTNIISNYTFPTSGGYGTAFYDINFNYLSGLSAAQTSNTPITVPTGAFYCRFYSTLAAVPSIVVVAGSTLPSGFVDYNYSPAPSSGLNAIIQSAINAASPPYRNLFDQSRCTVGQAIVISTGALSASAALTATGFIPVIAGQTYNFAVGGATTSATLGVAFYDASGNWVAAGPNLPVTTGQNFTVPAGASQMRCCFTNAIVASQMITLGTTPPAAYVPFFSGEGSVSPSFGKKFAFWGDSITATYGNYWQPTVLTRCGIINAFQDAHAGRNFGGAFENYSNNPLSGTNLGSGGPAPNTGTSGNTLAQDLAGLDGMICALGTNDYNLTLGSPGDATTAGTVYGNIRKFIEGVLTANPTMKLVMITPYNNQLRTGSGTLGVVNAILNVSSLYAIPVLDLYHLGNLHQFNWATQLQVDGLHPSVYGGANFLGPMISEFVKQYI